MPESNRRSGDIREEKLNEYYANDGAKVKKVVDKILLLEGFGWVTDHDHFYSLANEVFLEALRKYDGSNDFDGFFYTCMSNRTKSEVTRMNRQKRSGDKNTVSINTVVDETEDLTLEDMISNEVDIERDVLGSMGMTFSEEMTDYLESLSQDQKKILFMLAEGYKPQEIRERMNLNEKEYTKLVTDLRSYSKSRILIRRNSHTKEEDGEGSTLQESSSTFEKFKNDNYKIEQIDREMREHCLRDDHPLQRTSGQWNRVIKSEFVSDILRNNPFTQIIVSEEIENGVQMKWLIDGKQRCTTACEFMHDGFAISRNVTHWNVTYQDAKLDEDGNIIYNEQGFPIPTIYNFDIRGKKYSKLPKKLQEKFAEYNVPVLFILNCTEEQIADDIARFNRCRPMNVAQKGWTGMDKNFADLVDGILKMPFFKSDCPNSSYSYTSNTNGAFRRMVVESIVLSDFRNDVSRDFHKMCRIVSEKANDGTFTKFYLHIKRISEVAIPETADIFNIKNSFIWFAVFDAFTEFGLADSKFFDFLKAFKDGLCDKEVDGVSYAMLEEDKSTKDKSRVIAKYDFLVALMKDYFRIGGDSNADMKEWFINDTVGIDREEISENMDLYEQSLDDLEDRYMQPDSQLRDRQNRMSLLAIVAYMYYNDEDLDGWFAQYVSNHNNFVQNQKQNYQYMLNDFEEYSANQMAS